MGLSGEFSDRVRVAGTSERWCLQDLFGNSEPVLQSCVCGYSGVMVVDLRHLKSLWPSRVDKYEQNRAVFGLN